jgi:hypothetical protein
MINIYVAEIGQTATITWETDGGKERFTNGKFVGQLGDNLVIKNSEGCIQITSTKNPVYISPN